MSCLFLIISAIIYVKTKSLWCLIMRWYVINNVWSRRVLQIQKEGASEENTVSILKEKWRMNNMDFEHNFCGGSRKTSLFGFFLPAISPISAPVSLLKSSTVVQHTCFFFLSFLPNPKLFFSSTIDPWSCKMWFAVAKISQGTHLVVPDHIGRSEGESKQSSNTLATIQRIKTIKYWKKQVS